MAAKKNVRTRIKRSERKNIAVGAAHIKSTFNNTIVSITDPQGNVISWQSAGTVGFKGSRKSTPFAAQMAAEAAAKTAMEHGLRKVAVFVKGPGSGRETAIRSLQAAGLGSRQHPGLHTHSAQRLPSAQASSRVTERIEVIMARYTGADCRLCRREGAKLFLKGDRCYTDKCAIERRNYAPGEAGKKRIKESEYRHAAA